MLELLWVGDAACPSGFAEGTHGVLETIHKHFNVTVLGLNYRGDPLHGLYPYDIYAAAVAGDALGVGRIVWMCDRIKFLRGRKPDVIVIQNDPWNIPLYINQLKLFDDYKNIPVVGFIAVDGKNCRGADYLNDLALGIFWTQFALDEARAGGFTKPGTVVRLGVNRMIYKPEDMLEARRALNMPEVYNRAFIVMNVNRNQPRKRWDLSIKYFAEWIKQYQIQDAILMLHVAPTGDKGVDIGDLARYYGITDYVRTVQTDIWFGLPKEMMRHLYCSADVGITTTQGEGLGLTTLESMACGRPNVVPRWSALGEWADGAVQIPCSTTAVGPPYVNVIGGVVDEAPFIEALHKLYSEPKFYAQQCRAALACAAREEFDWDMIGAQFLGALNGVLAELPTEVSA
jgi:D-inositol-3-phosphate glycosyltransferase